jgi:hypothetical protein
MAWGGCFSLADCTFQRIRRKEGEWGLEINTGCVVHIVTCLTDVWNPIMAGATTGVILAFRRGRRGMIIGAIGGFVILSVMEGVMVWLQRRQVPDQEQMQPYGLPNMSKASSDYQ